MNVLLLVVALAVPGEAPKADMKEAKLAALLAEALYAEVEDG